MKLRSLRTLDRGVLREAKERAVSSASGPVPSVSVGWLFRSAALITVRVLLAGWWAEKPDSHGNRLLGTHPGEVLAVAFSGDGRWLASGGYNSPVVIWDMTLEERAAILEQSPATTFSAAFSPDGTHLATAGRDGTVRIWSTRSWRPTHVVQAHSELVRSLAFSPDGKLLATACGDQPIRLWDTATWESRSVLQGQDGNVRFVAFCPDGRRLASASNDGTVRVWNLELEGSSIALGPERPGKADI